VEEWVVLIVRIMILEFCKILFGNRYPIQWGLKEAFGSLRKLELTPPPYDDALRFHESYYCSTHIAFAITAYDSIRLDPKWVPWLTNYMRRSLEYWMDLAWVRLKVPSTYVDLDGVAEVCDVLRGAGATDANDRLVCSSSLWLLDQQNSNGSWPLWFYGAADKDLWGDSTENSYNKIHPTWVATQCLRDRNFELGRRGNQLWGEFMAKTLRVSDLATRAVPRIKYPPLEELKFRRKKKISRSTSAPRAKSKPPAPPALSKTTSRRG